MCVCVSSFRLYRKMFSHFISSVECCSSTALDHKKSRKKLTRFCSFAFISKEGKKKKLKHCRIETVIWWVAILWILLSQHQMFGIHLFSVFIYKFKFVNIVASVSFSDRFSTFPCQSNHVEFFFWFYCATKYIVCSVVASSQASHEINICSFQAINKCILRCDAFNPIAIVSI